MKKIIFFTYILLFSSMANADLVQEGKTLCSKIKSCAFEQIDQESLSQPEKDAILGIFDNQCLASVRKYETDLDNAGLEDQAHACLKSLQAQSCDILVGSQQVTTPVCTKFENDAKAAGITLGQ